MTPTKDPHAARSYAAPFQSASLKASVRIFTSASPLFDTYISRNIDISALHNLESQYLSRSGRFGWDSGGCPIIDITTITQIPRKPL
ncbi:hypothetical protein TWF481_011598 [Arthrobotrys musiformis]|uniref:Uncharacterized protein n=1 Tax=Arthrobotrys musiformis TaxID=47236 RepID=A0AAV9W4T0_9PEZI